MNWHTNQAFQYQYREDPGTENSLGVVRININNPYGVYMHDTSEKGVFRRRTTAFVSSGCIRVQNVRGLRANGFLKGHAPTGEPPATSTRRFRSGEQITVKLADPGGRSTGSTITAWGPTRNGIVEFSVTTFTSVTASALP